MLGSWGRLVGWLWGLGAGVEGGLVCCWGWVFGTLLGFEGSHSFGPPLLLIACVVVLASRVVRGLVVPGWWGCWWAGVLIVG